MVYKYHNQERRYRTPLSESDGLLMPRTQAILLVKVSNDSQITTVPHTPTPPIGHLREHSWAFSKSTQHMKQRKANSCDPLICQRVENSSLLWIWVSTIGLKSSIHSTADSLQSKIKSLASRLEPVLFPLPLHPLSPYPCLSVWPISGDDCLSASCPSVRLGRSTLLASSSPQPDRPEHSMAASWHWARTHKAHRALIQTNTSYFMCVSRRAGSQRGNRMFLTCFVMSQRHGLKPKRRAKATAPRYNEPTNASLSAGCHLFI